MAAQSVPGGFTEQLKGQHVFISGAAGPVGRDIIRQFLDNGCRVTAYDSRPLEFAPLNPESFGRLQILHGEITDEESLLLAIRHSQTRFGVASTLIVNPAVEEEKDELPIWEQTLEEWAEGHATSSRASFFAIKHFLQCVVDAKQKPESEDIRPVILVAEPQKDRGTVPLCVPLQPGFLRDIHDHISRFTPKGRINSVPFPIIPDDENGVVPACVAHTMAFLVATADMEHTSGHLSGHCIPVNLTPQAQSPNNPGIPQRQAIQGIPMVPTRPKWNKIRVAISIDLDAVSGWLGTNSHPNNGLADYSAGFFAAQVGVPRLLRMLKKYNLASRCTWFIPGHSAESFPDEVKQVVESGCEIGLHGYAHEGAYQLTPKQERDVLVRCIAISKKLTGKKPVGYRAPLYQLRESTLDLLEEFGFEYDASLTDNDCHPFFAPRRAPIKPIDFSKPAATWMHPLPKPTSPPDRRPLVCVPCNYYMEDMTPMQFLPHTNNSHGYVDGRVIENLWRERFMWIHANEEDPVFPLLMHPDTSGMAHVLPMIERVLQWMKEGEPSGEVEFMQHAEIARWWREKELAKGRR